MQPSILTRIARVYLLLVSIVAIYLGIARVTFPALSLPTPEFLSYLVPAGTLILLSPLYPSGAYNPLAVFFGVGVTMIVWGLLGILVLILAKRNVRWMYLWYCLAAFLLAVNTYGLTVVGVDLIALSKAATPVVMALAAYVVLRAGLYRVASGGISGGSSTSISRPI